MLLPASPFSSALFLFGVLILTGVGRCLSTGERLSRTRADWPTLISSVAAVPVCNATACLRPWETQRSLPTSTRFWSAALVRSAVAVHWPDSLRPLLTKLRAGHPITVVAFGSSVVENGAGCWASLEALNASGVATLPPKQADQLANSPSGTCRSFGWLAEFMCVVNSVWPHPRHALLNGGRGGAALSAFASHVCVDPWLPVAGFDLLVLESHHLDHSVEAAAALVRDVELIVHAVASKVRPPPASSAASPAVVLLNLFPVLNHVERDFIGNPCVGGFGVRCAECGPAAAASLAERLLASGFDRAGEDALAVASRRHGWSLVSLRDALAAGLRDGAHARLGWSTCEWMLAFSADRVHPSPQGYRFISDALAEMLLASQDALEADAAEAAAAFRPWAPVLRSDRPLSAGAFSQPPRACVNLDQLAPLVADGWQYGATETVRNVTVHKPGWIATTAGAVLEAVVSTRLAAPRGDDGGGGDSGDGSALPRVHLIVQYLVSYEGTGAAQLSCASGCECAPALLNGHDPAPVSVERARTVEVTQAQRCVLRLVVQPADPGAGGGTKFKLIGLTTKAA